MSEDVKYMMKRFSSHTEQILNAYKTSDEFKSLCEDFYSSALMLEDYKKKMLKDKRNELEYRRVFLDLESEILKFLGKEDKG